MADQSGFLSLTLPCSPPSAEDDQRVTWRTCGGAHDPFVRDHLGMPALYVPSGRGRST